MGKRKTTTISLLTLSIIGMTAFTSGHLSKSSSFSPTYALAQPAGPVAKSFEKYNGGKEKFVEELKKELSDNTSELRIWELGMPTFKDQNISISDLASKIPDGYKAVTIDGKLHHKKVVFIVKEDDVLVNDDVSYENQMKEIRQKAGVVRVHTLFDLKAKSHLDIILKSNGLRGNHFTYNGVNDVSLYSSTIGLANPYTEKYENTDITLEKIQKNDEELLKMIRESGADRASTEREKVKRWVVYLKKKIPYDFKALDVYLTDRQAYNRSSDLFAVATRKEAMCVGYSIATARAMNLLGLPSYMVEGITKNGARHATTRVFFDNAWHLVDSTGGHTGNQYPEYYYEFYFKNSLDQYQNITQAQVKDHNNNYMVINKEFEEWAKGQSTAKLLYVNADVALRTRIPVVLSQGIRDNLKVANENLKDGFEKMKSAVRNNELLQGRISELISSIDEDQKKISPDYVLTEEVYKEILNSIESNIVFYSQLQRELNIETVDRNAVKKLEESKQEIENKFQVEKNAFELTHKEIIAKNKAAEEKAKIEEAEAQKNKSQSDSLSDEDKERLEKQIKEESRQLDSKMSDAAKQSSSSNEQARTSSAASSTSSRTPQVRTNEESAPAKKRGKRSVETQDTAVSSTPVASTPAPAKAVSEPVSQPAVVTPRSASSAHPQPHARVETRRQRFRRSLEAPRTEASSASAAPAPAQAPQVRKAAVPAPQPTLTPRAPRTQAPAQPQSHYRNPNLENRGGRFSRLFSNHEPVTAPAAPASALISQPTPAPTRPASASVQVPNAQHWYHHNQYWHQPNQHWSQFNYHYQPRSFQSLNYK
ncbi:transglutaminase domain-containing protein [Streptococcus halichoeri]|uniref:transglutaminase domain-containing protein n=1 Tax=Streptococcus halichoeri TaxID=254785 RepID=UPI00135B4CA1|nr:transglutaminase domain-containing protein [Streptococcus halichoeri]